MILVTGAGRFRSGGGSAGHLASRPGGSAWRAGTPSLRTGRGGA